MSESKLISNWKLFFCYHSIRLRLKRSSKKEKRGGFLFFPNTAVSCYQSSCILDGKLSLEKYSAIKKDSGLWIETTSNYFEKNPLLPQIFVVVSRNDLKMLTVILAQDSPECLYSVFFNINCIACTTHLHPGDSFQLVKPFGISTSLSTTV